MKRTLLVLTCLSALSLAALAEDNEKTKPDNTATNERDRSGETKTSGDQTNSSADLNIKQPHTNERKSLCLNQYSVLQLHRAKLNGLSSSCRLKASEPRKFQCSCLIQAARVT